MKNMFLPVLLLLALSVPTLSVPALAKNDKVKGVPGPLVGAEPSRASNWRRHLLACPPEKKGKRRLIVQRDLEMTFEVQRQETADAIAKNGLAVLVSAFILIRGVRLQSRIKRERNPRI